MTHPQLLRSLACIAVPLALAACASQPLDTAGPAPVVTATPIPVGGSQVGPGSADTPTQPTALGAAGSPSGAADAGGPLGQKRSVWFAYDSATFNAGDRPTVESQGGYLMKHPDVRVQVAGNTDERGGSEYNLALGQRRAESVKSALELLGVKGGQVEAVSYGSEKPQATGHDEAAWQQNRRADFIYPSH
jgi:peptidoglycan-associated lipoprotein